MFWLPRAGGARIRDSLGTYYLALDLETTGLDTQADSIIEIGAIRFDDSGRTLERFETFVNPRRSIPHQIQALTGIRDVDVHGGPPLEVIAPDLQAFLVDDPLVGHNIIGFDTLFLCRAGIVHSPDLYDTQELSTLLLPGLPEYGLAALARHFGIEFRVQHRAAADAEVAARVFLELRSQAFRLPFEVLSQVATWLTPTAWPWRRFFAHICAQTSTEGRPFRLSAPAAPPALSPQKQVRPVPPEEPARILQSALGRPDLLPDFDDRAEQQEMVRAVTDALNNGQQLLVEAGTGIGKSLAYLIPAACSAVADGRRVVVSTATINLQEQLTRKDIPTLQGLMADSGLRACQQKGRRNYLCLKQFDALRVQESMTDEEALLAARILLWLCRTETGDKAELRLSAGEEALWHRLCADNVRCTAENSPYAVDGTCFLQRARRQAEASHIVVVNHALLLADSATGGQVLPPYEHLVVDEAHHLEDEATRQFGFSGGEKQLGDLLERCERLPRSLQSALQGTVASVPYDQLAGAIAILQRSAATAKLRIREFGQTSSAFLEDHSLERNEGEQRLQISRGMRVQPDWPQVEMAWENLRLALNNVLNALERLLALTTMKEPHSLLNQELMVAEIADILSGCSETATGISAAVDEDDPQRVVWLERDRSDGSVVISWVPLTVSGLLRENLYQGRASIVFTGATLRTQDNFSYLQERLGLEDAQTLALGSPFDYRQAALVLLPKDMPEPGCQDYTPAVARALIDLVVASRGRALVLFTSHAHLRSVHSLVQDPLRREGINALGQGVDGSPRQLVRALQANPNTVVLGTASFREGVDIAGEALSLLIVARLPFAVPTEPVFAARSALYDDPFAQYAVPQAVLRFKQGFGRLIRSKTDRGVLVVLDRRILSKSYGPAFTQSLPGCTFREATLREMPDLVEEWLVHGEQSTWSRSTVVGSE